VTDTSCKIIGIDPGSRITGYGIIEVVGSTHRLITQGHIRCQQLSFSQRLHHIHQQLSALLLEFNPEEAAIEEVFTCHNMQSALKLGQARGAALVALAHHTQIVHEYSAKLIKKSVVGYGSAEKVQVQHMVRSLLKLTSTPSPDAADALAIAICHANHRHLKRLLTEGSLT